MFFRSAMQLTLAVICVASYGCYARDEYSDLCVKTPSLACLRGNFDDLYQRNYPLFWSILHNVVEDSQKKESVNGIAAFMELAAVKTDNSEFNEFFNQTIEQLCLEKSDIFFMALLELKKPMRLMVISKLWTPMFFDISSIDLVFLRAKSEEKYQEIIELYFSERQEVR